MTPGVREETPGEKYHRLREMANQVLRGVTLALDDDPLSGDLDHQEGRRPRDHRHQEDPVATRG